MEASYGQSCSVALAYQGGLLLLVIMHLIRYIVGKRLPAEGLEARSSTDLKLSIASDKVRLLVVCLASKLAFAFCNEVPDGAPVVFMFLICFISVLFLLALWRRVSHPV